jgi:hypothetical protein
LGRDVTELRRFYHVPASNTAVGHIVLRPSDMHDQYGGFAAPDLLGVS